MLNPCYLLSQLTILTFQERPPASALNYVPYRQYWIRPTPENPDNVERIRDERHD